MRVDSLESSPLHNLALDGVYSYLLILFSCLLGSHNKCGVAFFSLSCASRRLWTTSLRLYLVRVTLRGDDSQIESSSLGSSVTWSVVFYIFEVEVFSVGISFMPPKIRNGLFLGGRPIGMSNLLASFFSGKVWNSIMALRFLDFVMAWIRWS